MQILKASYSYACNAYLLPTYYIKHRRVQADSSCIAFCTGKTEMPFEFEKYLHTRYCAKIKRIGWYVTRTLHTMTHTYLSQQSET